MRSTRTSPWPFALTGLCTLVVLKAAWLSDDAYITLRTIDNFWNGYGLRWNAIERVQAYTHPLWMLLLAAAYGITREAYATTIAVSVACAVATMVLLIKRLPAVSAALALLMLISSRAFVEFSTSGLENPLSHLLLVMFWLEALPGDVASGDGDVHDGGDGNGNGNGNARSIRRPTRFCVLAALCCLTRADLIWLVAPRVLAWVWSRPAKVMRSLCWGALPLIAWYLFATIYYGSPLPNTAFAKLYTGAPPAVLAQQGLYFLQESLMHDPLTVPTMIVACILAIARPSAASISLAIGIVLQMLYVVRVGGDFMSGRFLSAPFVCAALYVAQRAGRALTARRAALAGVVVVIIGVSAVTPASHWRFWTPIPVFGEPLSHFHGVIDERRFYYPFTGLIAVLQGHRPSDHQWAAAASQWRGTPRVIATEAVGLVGYHAGPGVHIVDLMALGDPLLARQPARPDWRIGHFERPLPDGYLTGLEACVQHLFPHGVVAPSAHTCLDWPAETNRLADPRLASQYELLRLVTQGPLFGADRLRAVVRLNLGW